MKIKWCISGILLVIILIMLFNGNNIKNFINIKLYRQLPNYSCSEGGLCMKNPSRKKQSERTTP